MTLTLAGTRTRLDRVFQSWKARPCFICQKTGRCPHREYKVELALVDAELRKALRPLARGVVSPDQSALRVSTEGAAGNPKGAVQ